MLSKAEILYLHGQKQVSGSYERKIKCLIRKKIENLKKELPLIAKIFPIDNLWNDVDASVDLKNDRSSNSIFYSAATENSNSKTNNTFRLPNSVAGDLKYAKVQAEYGLDQTQSQKTYTKDNFCPSAPSQSNRIKNKPKYCINNPSQIINQHESSGGVETLIKGHIVRLSILPSQGFFLTKNAQKSTILRSNSVYVDNRQQSSHVNSKDHDHINQMKTAFNDHKFWSGFQNHLRQFNCQKTLYSRISYTKRYHHLLISENFNELYNISKDKRNHVVKALSALSKYLGTYDRWKENVKRYNLKWSSGFDGLESFKRIMNSENNLESITAAMKDAQNDQRIPKGYRNIIRFCLLTGLMADEAISSISIIHNENLRPRYFSDDNSVIRHYEFPDIFIRKTKKAYISVINKDIIDIALSCPNVNINTFRSFIARRRIALNMKLGRKIFETYLHNKRIEPEIIDLIQGRISSSVFVNHYYRPDINVIITKRIKPVLDELRNELLTK